MQSSVHVGAVLGPRAARRLLRRFFIKLGKSEQGTGDRTNHPSTTCIEITASSGMLMRQAHGARPPKKPATLPPLPCPAWSWVPLAQRQKAEKWKGVWTAQQPPGATHHGDPCHSHLSFLHNQSHLLLCWQQNLRLQASRYLLPLSPTVLSTQWQKPESPMV